MIRPEELVIPTGAKQSALHRLIRFPAKFHPPVVDLLIRRYTEIGQTIWDPFCGSGTLMVEATRLGRGSVGSDIDPLAVAISRAKTRQYGVADLLNAELDVVKRIASHERSVGEYERRMFEDLDDADFTAEIGDLWAPSIPRINHWFRRYVIVDLARLLHEIKATECTSETMELLLVVFAAIIRNSSNADPVPVSGLEVTSHMTRRDAAGRLVNPFALFRARLHRSVQDISDLADTQLPEPLVILGDATELRFEGSVDAVITSPPYHNAVDYYRRHQLEMFWLGLTENQSDRLELLPKYIGKGRVAMSHPMLRESWTPSPAAQAWMTDMAEISPARARDFRAYMTAMSKVFINLGETLPAGAPALFVVGRSAWNGDSIRTDELFTELAAKWFTLEEHLTYPVKNRYMSYARKNGANIDAEHVAVFVRR